MYPADDSLLQNERHSYLETLAESFLTLHPVLVRTTADEIWFDTLEGNTGFSV